VRAVALVPAHNEAERIGATVRAIASVPEVVRMLVIDDGSTDATADRAAQAGAEVVRLPRNVGKGDALNAGLAALDEIPDVLLLLDADLGPTAAEAGSLIAPVASGEADMTIATLPPPERKSGFGLVVRLARAGIRRLARFEATAPLSGQRALGPRALAAGTPFAHGFGVEVALTVRVVRAGGRVVEVPTTMRHAATGRDLAGFLHRGRQFLSVARVLVALAFEAQSPGTRTG
jgi:hypothetical protein